MLTRSVLGGDNNLGIRIDPFPYSGVRCSNYVGGPGIIDSCTNLANSMEASTGSKIFGTTTASQVHLPYSKSGKACILRPSVPFGLTIDIIDGNRCALIISILSHESQSQPSSWYTVWQAVVAINAQCIRRGMSGFWADLGTDISRMIIRIRACVPTDMCSCARVTSYRYH